MTEESKAVEAGLNLGSVVKPTECADFIQHVMQRNFQLVKEGRAKERLVPCIWGPAGIGKTDSIRSLEKVGVLHEGKLVYPKVVHIALAQIEETGDITGLPVVTKNDKGESITSFAPPEWWPTDEMTENGTKPVILLFDDFNRADPRILKAIMQLLQDYRSNVHELPETCTIALTGNPPNASEAEYMVNEIDSAIKTRMLHVTMRFDHKDWGIWAQGASVDKRVISFVLRYPELFNGKQGERTNPRSTVQFSNLIKNITDLKTNEKMVTILANSTMDEDVATSFSKFVFGDLQKIVEPEEILESWKTAEPKLDALKKSTARGEGKDKLRADIIGVIADRMYVHLMQPNIELTEVHFESFLQFIKRTDLIPEDMMYTLLRRLRRDAKTPKQQRLFTEMIQYGGDEIADLIMNIA